MKGEIATAGQLLGQPDIPLNKDKRQFSSIEGMLQFSFWHVRDDHEGLAGDVQAKARPSSIGQLTIVTAA